MKTLSLTCLGTIFCFYSRAQESSEPHNYITTDPVVVYAYDFLNSVSCPDSMFIAKEDAIFELKKKSLVQDGLLGEVYLIQFWPYPNKLINDKTKNEIDGSTTRNNEIYCIKKSDFEENVEKRYKTLGYNRLLTVGVLSVPLKIRPKKAGIPTDLTTDLSFDVAVGACTRISRYKPNYISLVGIIGYSGYNVDSLTTRGQYSQTTNLHGMTYGFGLIIELNRVQISAISGWDMIGGMPGKDWVYNRRNWIGLGIGYELWKPERK